MRAMQRDDGDGGSRVIGNMSRAWDDFYRAGHVNTPTPFTITVGQRLVSMKPAPAVIVDLGCGNGTDSHYFASMGFAVIGIGRSVVGVAAARSLALRSTDVADVPFPESPTSQPPRHGAVMAAALDGVPWRSQESNVKLRTLARQLLLDVRTLTQHEGSLPSRPAFDRLLLTADQRARAKERAAD